jgi:hypothetical protein
VTIRAQTFRRLERWARRGFHGGPVGTVAFYGPTNELASKVVVGLSVHPDQPADILGKWFSESADIRLDQGIGQAILAVLDEHGVRSVAMSRGIIGCPHEEGIDYPDGQPCPQCPFWRNRDRWKEA